MTAIIEIVNLEKYEKQQKQNPFGFEFIKTLCSSKRHYGVVTYDMTY